MRGPAPSASASRVVLLVVMVRSVPARILYRVRGGAKEERRRLDEGETNPIQNPIASNRIDSSSQSRCFVLRRLNRTQNSTHIHSNYPVPNRPCSSSFSSNSSTLLIFSLVKGEHHKCRLTPSSSANFSRVPYFYVLSYSSNLFDSFIRYVTETGVAEIGRIGSQLPAPPL